MTTDTLTGVTSVLEALDEAGLDMGDLSGDLLGEMLGFASDAGRRLAHDSTLGPLDDLLPASPTDRLEVGAAASSKNDNIPVFICFEIMLSLYKL